MHLMWPTIHTIITSVVVRLKLITTSNIVNCMDCWRHQIQIPCLMWINDMCAFIVVVCNIRWIKTLWSILYFVKLYWEVLKKWSLSFINLVLPEMNLILTLMILKILSGMLCGPMISTIVYSRMRCHLQNLFYYAR